MRGGVKLSGAQAGFVVHVAATLYASPFPAEQFQFACDIARDYNHLVHQVSLHPDFILQTLER